jgi:hypothetical protein
MARRRTTPKATPPVIIDETAHETVEPPADIDAVEPPVSPETVEPPAGTEVAEAPKEPEIIEVIAATVNLRSAPRMEAGNIVGVVHAGDQLGVVKHLEDWVQAECGFIKRTSATSGLPLIK